MNTEKSSGLNLIPKQLPNESLLGDFARDSTFRRTLQPLSDAQRRAILWTAALQTSFIQQQVERKIDGFRFASVGFADPETEEDAFGVFAYTLPLFDEERRLVLRADGREFPIFVRPAFEELHSLPNVHPLAGTSTCWAKSSKSGVQAEVLLLTAKHVVAHATAPAEPVVGSPVPTTYGTGRVVGLAPGSIDAVLVRLPTGIHGQIGKSLEYLQYIALWTDVHFQGMGSRKTVNTKITEVWFRGPDPSLPARVFLAWPGEHGDSGALVLDSDGKGIGIYIGGWVNIATSRMEGFCQHLGQAADVLGCNLFQ